jgi:RimJ/RimL family protein N-acetyltransferase/acyl carrier protein
MKTPNWVAPPEIVDFLKIGMNLTVQTGAIGDSGQRNAHMQSIESTSNPATPPRLETSHVLLREIVPSDYPYLYHIAADPASAFRWRFRSSMPSYEEFVGGFRAPGVLIQLIVISKQSARPLGIVICYRVDFRNRHAYLGVQGDNSTIGSGIMAEATRLFVDYLFECYDFDKLYAESFGFSFPAFEGVLKRHAVLEGQLKDHERFLGRSWDLFLLAVYRETWLKNKRQRPFQITDRLQFEEFAYVLAAECGLDLQACRPEALLVEDLGIDSLSMMEMVAVAESNGGVIAEPLLVQVRSLGDLHFAYLQSTSDN